MNSTAIYLRVSSTKQDTANQLPAAMAWCESHGYNRERVELYQEQESSWQQGHQHELARLLDDLRKGRRKYDFLIVFAIDRLCRQGIAATLQLINSFEVLGCRVVSIKESWIAEGGPLREVFIAMTSWAAEYESTRKSQNTRLGLDRARAAGKTLGRPVGKKDKKPRRRAGYLLRYVNKGATTPTPEKMSVG